MKRQNSVRNHLGISMVFASLIATGCSEPAPEEQVEKPKVEKSQEEKEKEEFCRVYGRDFTIKEQRERGCLPSE